MGIYLLIKISIGNKIMSCPRVKITFSNSVNSKIDNPKIRNRKSLIKLKALACKAKIGMVFLPKKTKNFSCEKFLNKDPQKRNPIRLFNKNKISLP
jgi:hypothetical protein